MAVDRVAKEWPDLLVQIRFPLPLLLLVLVHIAAARIFAPGYLAILDAEESPSEEETDWGAA